MPIRVKSRPSQADVPLRTPSPMGRHIRFGAELPDISEEDGFRVVVKKLSVYIAGVIVLPSTFEQLRTTGAGEGLRVLVDHLSRTCTHPAIVNALLALKWHYGAITEDKSLNDARANACEIVAWRFLTHLSEREAVDYCLYEIPDSKYSGSRSPTDEEEATIDERSALLGQAIQSTANSARRALSQTGNNKRNLLLHSISRLTMSMTGDDDDDEEEDPTAHFTNLNALEIAAIADAKRFLSQAIVQKIITGIWNGDIIFWDTLAVHSVKKPRFYNPSTADPFSRLRVPKYLKSFEVLFFACFLFLYYAVLVERNPTRITTLEIFLYLWFVAFAYDELSEWIDAGSVFYAADVWNIFDMVMIGIGFAYAVMRIVGLETGNAGLVDLAFDVLALEALFMVPRVFSILSLSPYWGTLIPCLKEMGKDFLKFMVLVVVVYLGFLTTFSLVGREMYSLKRMTLYLTKIFFGSSSVGFDIMHDIDPIFGPPLMIIFIMLSSILLTGSLTGMLSNSFSRVITHAREEYLYVYSVYVLEASTSNRLTHFYPPFNLLALVIFRPLRLFLPSDDKFRKARILLLKATHLPIVAAIELYEWLHGDAGKGTHYSGFRGPRHSTIGSPNPAKKLALHRQSTSSSLRHDPPSALNILRPPPPAPATSASEGPLGSMARLTRRQQQAAAEAAEEQAFGDPATDVEVRIADLAAKIDRLTELVVALQAQQSRGLTDVSVA
ncbi:Calcium channel YVC1 [Madurella mycetomatis]|uniref:Calcium channel YVC1 n=1 Tax=Madurella mycetomatis TaxID=100816 RepID=A0A175VTS7_9PEZI|nr:Calcium channel YVC1 [Madurella mycetomatis]